jgi:hypothetical protein
MLNCRDGVGREIAALLTAKIQGDDEPGFVEAEAATDPPDYPHLSARISPVLVLASAVRPFLRGPFPKSCVNAIQDLPQTPDLFGRLRSCLPAGLIAGHGG